MRGGTIAEFDHAVHLTGASHNHITRLEATRSGDTDIGRAILLDTGSDDNLIDGNDASFNGRSGVAVLDSSRNVITRNRTNHNDVAGMGVFGGADNQVTANVMTDNGETASSGAPAIPAAGSPPTRSPATRKPGSSSTRPTKPRSR